MKPFNPQTTTFTNQALDKIMPIVSPNAWKIICFAYRKTAGWIDRNTESGRKESDVISISQFRTGCGISSNDTVLKAIDECLASGYILREKEGNTFRYRINTEYEIVTETVTPIVTETVTEIVTETVNTNSKLTNKVNSKEQAPAKKNGDQMNKEDYLESVKKSLEKSLISQTTGYAHYPERLIPVVQRMDQLWHFKVPEGRGKEYGYWVKSCDEVLSASAEFGAGILDKLHEDWMGYLNSHEGFAPFTVSGPQSLVKSVLAKAAMLRGGNTASLWGTNGKKERQSNLDF